MVLVLLCFFFCWFAFLFFVLFFRYSWVFQWYAAQPKLISRSTLSQTPGCVFDLFVPLPKISVFVCRKALTLFQQMLKNCNIAHLGCALNAFVTMSFILYYLSQLYLSCRSTNEQMLICSGTAEWIYCNLFKPGRQRWVLYSQHETQLFINAWVRHLSSIFFMLNKHSSSNVNGMFVQSWTLL